jgi:hypothetical protein
MNKETKLIENYEEYKMYLHLLLKIDIFAMLIKLTITGNPIEMALKLFTNQRIARHKTWIPVNIWTFFNGTCRRYL